MPMRDLYHKTAAAVVIDSATYSADTTPVAVDLQGCKSALFLIEVGAGGISFSGTNKIEFVMTHSDDNSSYSNVAAADVIGVTPSSGIVYSLTTAHASATVTPVSYVGGKRYVKVLADFSGTHGTGTPLSVAVVKSNLDVTTA